MKKTENDTSPRGIVVIGIGNDFRSDDGVGPMVARRLKELCLPGVQILTLSGEGGDLLRVWDEYDSVLLVDGVVSSSSVGTIHRIDVNNQTVPTELFRHSSHAFGVADCIEVARILGTLPNHCIVFGIEIQDVGMGTAITSAVTEAANEAVRMIKDEINAMVMQRVSVA